MDSDDSRDDVSSGSDSESNVKGSRSPASVQSGDGDSQDFKRQSPPRGPRSPSPCGPRSPSPVDSIQSNSPQSSPKRNNRSPSNERYDTIKSPSVPSESSNDAENTRNSLKSDLDEENENGVLSPKSSSSHSSNKSKTSSVKSSAKNSIKSLSPPARRTPMSPKSPDHSPERSVNTPERSVNSYKSAERRGPMSPVAAEDGNSSDSSVSSRGSVGSVASRTSRGSRRSLESRGSRRSRGSRASAGSRESRGSKGSRGSRLSRNSSRNKSNDRLDAQAEEISDGEMEYDGGKDTNDIPEKTKVTENVNINLSHEDLSDVSDLDSMNDGAHSDNDSVKSDKPTKPPMDLRQKLEEAKSRKLIEKNTQIQNPPEKTSKTEDGEEQLDFEAEDGECIDETVKAKPMDGPAKEMVEEEEGALPDDAEKEKEEVEEGEVTDDDEVRPEETEPRPVCRFYSRGQCTWGASCRFLHPGVTDKGNYTMFELIRPMVPGAPGYTPEDRFERPGYTGPPARGEPPVIESAWERGLRTAKEMMRKAIKRKEQDMDFEEKKMNLTLTQDELDKENGYYTRAPSPIPVEPVPRHYVTMRHPMDYARQGGGEGLDARRQRHVTVEKNRHAPVPVPTKPRIPEEYYPGRRVVYEPAEPRAVRIEPEYEVPRERTRTYRELPAHRMPDYYNDKYEEPPVAVRRPKREVIVQRIEPPAGAPVAGQAAGGGGGRGDEWADPWMRSKSPGGRGKVPRVGSRRQSYSSASSYSSSSSSRSTSGTSKSFYRGDSRSRSRSPNSRRRRPKSPSHRSHRTAVPGGIPHRTVSPSVIITEKKAANERALLMNPPAPSPKKSHKDNRPPSPGMMRTSAQNPPAPTKQNLDQYGRSRDRSKVDSERKKLAVAAALVATAKSRARMSHSTSGSDSSGSSSSDSESSYSSSSSSHDGSPPRRKPGDKVDLALALKAKALDALKSGGDKRQIKLNLKAQALKKTAELNELNNRKGDKLELLNKKRPAGSPPDLDAASAAKIQALSKGTANSSSKKSTSRREELLKQLKAVEDAIAKKRSKIN